MWDHSMHAWFMLIVSLDASRFPFGTIFNSGGINELLICFNIVIRWFLIRWNKSPSFLTIEQSRLTMKYSQHDLQENQPMKLLPTKFSLKKFWSMTEWPLLLSYYCQENNIFFQGALWKVKTRRIKFERVKKMIFCEGQNLKFSSKLIFLIYFEYIFNYKDIW
jgi:hypothetical protein